jgi:hypothetical protein
MSTKAELLARHGVVNGSLPLLNTAVMDGEAMVTDHAVSEAPRLAAQIAPDMADYELKPAPVDPVTAFRDAVDALDRARYQSRLCRQAVSAAREDFNMALAAWNHSGPAPQTQESLRAEWMAGNQEQRRLKAEAGRMQRPATVSETAAAMRGGNRRPGGGASYKRGAVTRAEARTIEVNKMAAARMHGNIARAKKLPSQR